MEYAIELLLKELKRLEEENSPIDHIRKLKIAELQFAISTLREESDQFTQFLES